MIKCLSFQNQFWSIIFYLVSLVVSLSIINIDQSVYTTLELSNTDIFNGNQTMSNQFLNNVNTVRTLYFLICFHHMWIVICEYVITSHSPLRRLIHSIHHFLRMNDVLERRFSLRKWWTYSSLRTNHLSEEGIVE